MKQKLESKEWSVEVNYFWKSLEWIEWTVQQFLSFCVQVANQTHHNCKFVQACLLHQLFLVSPARDQSNFKHFMGSHFRAYLWKWSPLWRDNWCRLSQKRHHHPSEIQPSTLTSFFLIIASTILSTSPLVFPYTNLEHLTKKSTSSFLQGGSGMVWDQIWCHTLLYLLLCLSE